MSAVPYGWGVADRLELSDWRVSHCAGCGTRDSHKSALDSMFGHDQLDSWGNNRMSNLEQPPRLDVGCFVSLRLELSSERE